MPLDKFSIDGAGLHIENYIYMYHLQEFIVLPSFVDSVQENFQINWSPQTILGRSAPIYSFQSAGPRTLQVTFTLHRDMMWQINHGVSTAQLSLGDDYVDTLIKDLQACVLPDYDGTSKAVNPPIIAMRIGNDIFIKGIITGSLGYTWNYPILENGKYSNLSIGFSVTEIDPYDARLVRKVGSYRNVSTDLDYSNVYDIIDSPETEAQKNVGQTYTDEQLAFINALTSQGLHDMNTIRRLYLAYKKSDPEWLNSGFEFVYSEASVVNQPTENSALKDVAKTALNVAQQLVSSTTPQEMEKEGSNRGRNSNGNQGVRPSGAGQNTNEVQ